MPPRHRYQVHLGTRLVILVTVAFSILGATGSFANAAQQCYVNSTGQLEINVGSQFGYSDNAARTAISIAEANGCQVYFQPGIYYYDSPLVNNGLRFRGQCSDNVAEVSVLSATNPDGSAIFLRGDRPEITCLKMTSPHASIRRSSNSAHGITIDHATNFLVDHVTVDRTAAAGIFNRGGSNGRITSNRVLNTLADGIHNTRGASHTDIASNTVWNTGDDFIAVVSYVWQGVESHDITIIDNTLNTQLHGRGITVSGGYNIKILRNDLHHCRASCVYIASEPESSWNTYGVDNVEIAENFVRFPDEGLIHNANVLLWCGSANRHVQNVYGGNNRFDRSRDMIRTVAEDGCAVSGITASGFYSE
jgi:hypothetical protein